MRAKLALLLAAATLLSPSVALAHHHHPLITSQQAKTAVIASQTKWNQSIITEQVSCTSSARYRPYAVCRLHVFAPSANFPLPDGTYLATWSTYYRNVYLARCVAHPAPGEIFGEFYVGPTYGG